MSNLYIYLQVICLIIRLNQVVATREFCIFRLWKYNTQNKTRSRCNNHFLHHRHSYDYAGHEVTGGTISHQRQIPGYQNWNYSSQEDRAEACEIEDNLRVELRNCFPACLSTSFTENWSFLESFYGWFITLSTIGFGDCAFAKVFKRNRCGKMSKLLLILYIVLFSLPYVISLS